MVDKLIWGKIVEIIIVIGFVIVSIPIWKNFEERFSTAKVTTLDDYNMYFDIYEENDTDTIIATNEFYINKNYKILLVVDEEIDVLNSTIKINEENYNLKDFYSENKGNKVIYTLVDTYISADTNYFDIKPSIIGKNINYSYDFVESNIF